MGTNAGTQLEVSTEKKDKCEREQRHQARLLHFAPNVWNGSSPGKSQDFGGSQPAIY